MAGGMKGLAKQLETIAAKQTQYAKEGGKLGMMGVEEMLKLHGYEAIREPSLNAKGKQKLDKYGQPKTHITGIQPMTDETWLQSLPENERTRILLERQSLAHVQSLIGTGEEQGFQAPEWLKTQYQQQLNDLQSNMVNQLGPNAITSSAYADAKSKLDANYNQSMQQIALQELGAYDTLSTTQQQGYQSGVGFREAPLTAPAQVNWNTAAALGGAASTLGTAGQARMGSAQISAGEDKGGGGWGSIIGSIAGTALGSLAGGAGGAIGSKLGAWAGSKLF